MFGLTKSKPVFTALMIGTVLVLGACREEEQDRFIMFEPGVYKGNPDTTLSRSDSDEMRNRTALQAGSNLGTGAVSKSAGDIRPPGAGE